MLEKIHGIPQRIADLQAKLKARTGKKEYKENCEAIQKEIAHLEALTANRDALEEFVTEEASAVASTDAKVT